MKVKIITGCFLAVISISLLAGCASTKTMKTLEADNAKMSEENFTLQRQLEEKTKESEEKDLRIVSLEKENEEQRIASEKEVATLTETFKNLKKELKNEISQGQIEIQNIKGKLNLTIAAQLFFETGKADITPRGEAVLKRIAVILKKVPEKNIRVEGHTDNVPIVSSLKKVYPTNWELGSARATTVARFFQEKTGIDPLRLSSVSYGQYRPVASNKTESGRAQNRRIEIILIDRDLDLAKKMRGNL